MVTQALAVKYLDDVTALVLANVNHAQTEQSKAGLLSRASAAREHGMAGIVESSMQRWFTGPFIARGAGAPVRASLANASLDAWCDGYGAMANIDTAPKLRGITAPVLCLAGELDQSMPPAAVKAMADARTLRAVRRRAWLPRTCSRDRRDARGRRKERDAPGCVTESVARRISVEFGHEKRLRLGRRPRWNSWSRGRCRVRG